MKKCLFFFAFLSFINGIFSQESGEATIDSIALKEGLHLHGLAGKVYSTNIDSAIFYIKSAIPYFKESGAHVRYTTELLTLSAVLKNASRYNEFYESALFSVEECKNLLGETHPNYAGAMNNLSGYYYDRGDYEKSIELIKKSIRTYQANKVNKPRMALIFQNLANTYVLSGDYEQALSYLEQVLKIRYADKDNNPFALVDTYNAFAWNFGLHGKPDSARAYYIKSLNLLSKQENNRTQSRKLNPTIRTYQGAAENAIEQQYYQKALEYINKALEHQSADNAFRKAKSFELRGRVYQFTGHPEKALKEYMLARDIAERTTSNYDFPGIARKYLKIAEAYRNLNNNELAVANYQKALRVLAPEFASNDPGENPGPSMLYSKSEAMGILDGKGKTLWEIYQDTKDTAILSQSFKAFKRGTTIVKDLRQGVVSVEAKNIFSEKSVSIFEGAIRAALEQYRISESEEMLLEAFTLTESNKSLLLLEYINEQAALGLKGLPDSLLQKDKELRLGIAFYQKQLIEVSKKEKEKSDTKINRWKKELFDIKAELQTLTDHFEQAYPRFHKLKYQDDNIKLSDWQKMLASKKQGLIEYFVGEEKIYYFALWAEGCQVFEIDNRNAVFQSVGKLRSAISQVPKDEAVLQNYQDITSSGYFLYQNILAPVLKVLPKDIRSLKIIPDDQLNYVPFDLLLMEKAPEEEAYFSTDHLEYVLEKYTVSYDYSATWMLKNQDKNNNNYTSDFIAYAPSFKKATGAIMSRSCEEGELYSLECSEEEVEGIKELLHGEIRMGSAASKSDFEKEAANYRIIHMATHACADEANPLFNKIFLTDDYLSNSDLYNTSLNAELVVLSACNTGSGKLVKGEGVLSLARGFVQAGCASSVVSRWSVDDCATSEIMGSFYKELKAKHGKDQALRLAKLAYLNGADRLQSHPYYWSAFVGYGDMGSMDLGRDNKIVWILLSIVVLIILGIARKRS